MSGNKIIQCVAQRENLTTDQAEFLERVILSVREDCEKANSHGPDSVIVRLLAEYVKEGVNQ